MFALIPTIRHPELECVSQSEEQNDEFCSKLLITEAHKPLAKNEPYGLEMPLGKVHSFRVRILRIASFIMVYRLCPQAVSKFNSYENEICSKFMR